MCNEKKKYQFIKKTSDLDGAIEVALVSYSKYKPEDQIGTKYEVRLMEFKEGKRINKQTFTDKTRGRKEKYLEIIKSFLPTWEKTDSQQKIDNLEECYECDDTDKCIGCMKKFLMIK